jgi:hypothetical protein
VRARLGVALRRRERGGEAGRGGLAGQRGSGVGHGHRGQRVGHVERVGHRRLVVVAHVEAGRARVCVDLDDGLLEEPGDAALEALAAADDHGVGAELVAHLRERFGERAGAERLRGGGGGGAHADTTPMVSTLIPGAISL